MGAEEGAKTSFQPKKSYFTVFFPPIKPVQGLPNAESDAICGMFFPRNVAAVGAEEWLKTCFQPENSCFKLYFPIKKISRRLPWSIFDIILTHIKELLRATKSATCAGGHTFISVANNSS